MSKTVLICARLFDGLNDTLTGPLAILIVTSKAPVAYGTEYGMFPFSHGILEFQAMVAAGPAPLRALKAATSVAASLLQQDDIGVLASGKQADIVAMAVHPISDIAATEKVDFVMKAGRIYRHQTFDVFQFSWCLPSHHVTRGIIGAGTYGLVHCGINRSRSAKICLAITWSEETPSWSRFRIYLILPAPLSSPSAARWRA
jgi:hypothetical protein